jgi:tRNA(Glu) U13 pseudouridine synthase TruD
MFGASMRSPSATALELERTVLRERALEPSCFAPFHKLGEGTRRPLRSELRDLTIAPDAGGLIISFALPKGSYATTVLGLACRLVEPPHPPHVHGSTQAAVRERPRIVEDNDEAGSTSDG